MSTTFCRFDKRDIRRSYCLEHRTFHPEHQAGAFPSDTRWNQAAKRFDLVVAEPPQPSREQLAQFEHHAELFTLWRRFLAAGDEEHANACSIAMTELAGQWFPCLRGVA